MSPGVSDINFLSFLLDEIQKKGQFWNPQNEQISKLRFLFEFGEYLRELLPKNKLGTFFVDTLYIYRGNSLSFTIFFCLLKMC